MAHVLEIKMKTAGVVFDFYDDPSGEILKTAFPTQEALPGLIKTAHILNDMERKVLRDEAYALVFENDGVTLRKFACIDPGNTLMSAVYFEKTAYKLPEELREEARTKIASRLKEFFPPDPLDKLAVHLGMSKKRDPRKMKDDNSGQKDWEDRTNMVQGFVEGDDSPGAAQTKTSMPVAYDEVKAAVQYFNDLWPEMSPLQRHEFAEKTASRADELGIEVSDRMRRYGSTSYAEDVDDHLTSRAAHAPVYKEVYASLKEKRASLEPEEFAVLLQTADDSADLVRFYGGVIQDPYFSTFGYVDKLASWSWTGPTGDHVNSEQLDRLARNARPLLKKHFSDEMVDEFCKSPVEIFESLPDDMKIILSRLGSDEFTNFGEN